VTEKRIRETARRIARLGRYVGDNPGGPHVVKSKGLITMVSGPLMPVYSPREGTVWLRSTSHADLKCSPEEALQWLVKFEAEILAVAEAKAREEVVTALVKRKIRQIVRRGNKQ